MSILHLELTGAKSKDVAQLLANNTARKIMDAVTEDSKSESQIAKELDIPLSTVHYNVTKLTEAGLLTTDEFTYSQKSKEVRHYKLTSQHVVITTRPVANITSLLTGIGLSLALAATFFIHDITRITEKTTTNTAQYAARSAPVAEESAGAVLADTNMLAAAPEPAEIMTQADPAIWPYILLGAAIMLLGILLANVIQKKKK